MLITGFKALLGITVILCGWLLVQALWRRGFPQTPADEDVLAGRLGCHNCACPAPCNQVGRDDTPPLNDSELTKG